MKRLFSQRQGFAEVPTSIYLDSIPDPLRNSLWNFVHDQFESRYDRWIPLAKFVAKYFRKIPIDELPYSDYDCRKWFKAYFYSLIWFELYDLIEFLVTNNGRILEHPTLRGDQLIDNYNFIFERESAGYRFINGSLAPISNPAEVSELNEAIQSSRNSGMLGAQKHLSQAIALLSRKPEPDFRNAIKEAISAVESIANSLSGANSAGGLAVALRVLSETAEIHPALKKGFVALYGYTSDEDGIRHAILEEKHIGYEEAKFMVVSCSAFVNFLLGKGANAKLL